MYKLICLAVVLLLAGCCKEPGTPATTDTVVGGGSIATVPEGALNRRFSIGDGNAVYFSRGNLQYKASTGTWRFAGHQYDYIGSANANIAADYDGWIDLLGWGTSGWEGAGICYQPWAAGNNYTDYGPSGEYGLTGSYANADWGVYCPIANGGGKAGLWRTPTREEWDYLFASRADAAKKWGYATVAGVHGIIVLPDSFSDPMSGADGSAFVHSSAHGWDANIYEGNGWASMEAAGALFLPAAGDRNGTSVGGCGDCGDYWSSSCNGESGAGLLFFSSNDLYTYCCGRACGFAVRLIAVE